MMTLKFVMVGKILLIHSISQKISMTFKYNILTSFYLRENHLVKRLGTLPWEKAVLVDNKLIIGFNAKILGCQNLDKSFTKI